MALSLAGCGDDEPADPAASPSSTAAPKASAETAAPSPTESTESSSPVPEEFIEVGGETFGKYIKDVKEVDGKVSVYTTLPNGHPMWHSVGFTLCSGAVQVYRPSDSVVVFASGGEVMTSAAGPNPMGMDCRDFPR